MDNLEIHALHLPLRFGWRPLNVRALLSNVMPKRPGPDGTPVECETWDNAVLATELDHDETSVPMTLSTKRIAPSNANTWRS